MKSEWKAEPLGNVISYISKGIPPVYVERESDYTIRVLNQKCNRDFKISYEESRLHDLSKRNIPKEKYLCDEDILINSTGTGTAGRVAQIKTVPCPTTVDGHMIILRANEKIVPRYLGYSIKAHQSEILQLDEGSTGQTELNRDRLLSEIIISYPVSIDEQNYIANTLSALDEKIETNTKINHHLEQMAQAIFKSWFVDFEPWGGVMPEDWRESVLSDICDYNVERTSVASLTCDTYISTENMLPNKGGFVSAANLPTIAQTTAFRNGDTLISNIRPYFKKIIYCSFSGGCSTDVLCFRPHESRLSLFLYNILHFDRFFEYMVAGSKGTKMPRGDKQQIINYAITIPTENILDDFINVISPISIQQTVLTDENKRLTSLRDTLLPRLMSGDLSVADL